MEPAQTITPPQNPPNPPVTQKKSKSSLILTILLVILITTLFLMVAVLFTYSNKVNRLTQAVDIGNSRAASLSEEKQLLETENTGLKEQAESHESEISGDWSKS